MSRQGNSASQERWDAAATECLKKLRNFHEGSRGWEDGPALSVGWLAEAIDSWYRMEGNEVGGAFHIVFDDDNIEDDHVIWCMNFEGNDEGYPKQYAVHQRLMGQALLAFTENERAIILNLAGPYARPAA